MIRLAVQVCMPCLIFDTIVATRRCVSRPTCCCPARRLRHDRDRNRRAYLIARVIAFPRDGLRTFALSAGSATTATCPFRSRGYGERSPGRRPRAQYGRRARALVGRHARAHGSLSPRGWRRLLSRCWSRWSRRSDQRDGSGALRPGFIRSIAHSLGVCAVPIGVVMTASILPASWMNLKALAQERCPGRLRRAARHPAGAHARLRLHASLLGRAEAGAGRRGGDAGGRDPDHPRAVLRRAAPDAVQVVLSTTAAGW